MNKSLKTVVITGYARSGKTTAIKVFEENGYKPQSSSIILHNLAQSMLTILGEQIDREDKTRKLKCGITYREFLIRTAENALVPNLGRNIFVGAMELGDNIVYELFNNEEYDVLCKRLGKKPIVVAIRGKREQPDIDDREIIKPDYIIYNNYNTVEEYQKVIKHLINTL